MTIEFYLKCNKCGQLEKTPYEQIESIVEDCQYAQGTAEGHRGGLDKLQFHCADCHAEAATNYFLSRGFKEFEA